MLALKVPKKESESQRKALIEKGRFDHSHKIMEQGGFILIPIKDRFATPYEIVDADLERYSSKKTLSFREQVERLLGKKDLKTAFDIVGDIAILELDEAYVGHEKEVGELLLGSVKNITAVYMKEGAHEGEFRVQKLSFIAGKAHHETIHKENNVRLKIDPSEVYFSARQSTERARVMKQVRKGEDVLVMFSGIGPFVCVIAKNTEVGSVIGIEKNPVAHRYAEMNISLNKLKNAQVYLGDVRELVPKLERKFDRIFMPLPRGAEDFLDTALSAIKKGGIIHFYNFLHESEFGMAEEMAEKACIKAGFNYEKIALVKCGQQGPGIYRICLDFRAY